MNDRDLIEAVRIEAQPLTGVGANYDYLLGLIGDARFVLLGEAGPTPTASTGMCAARPGMPSP
jgi:hypothetical protein